MWTKERRKKQSEVLKKAHEEGRHKAGFRIGNTLWNNENCKNTQFKKGHLHNPSVLEKISVKLKGRTAWNKGKPAPWLVERNKSQRQREAVSKSQKGIPDPKLRGNTHGFKKGHNLTKASFKKGHKPWNKDLPPDKQPTWRGGKSFEPYQLEFNRKFKEQIRQRDNYRCQQCFRHQEELRTKTNKKYKLHIHHIDYNKKNNNPDNLISLCSTCHAQTGFNREDWTNYFNKNKMDTTK